jgi:hypothetical protein
MDKEEINDSKNRDETQSEDKKTVKAIKGHGNKRKSSRKRLLILRGGLPRAKVGSMMRHGFQRAAGCAAAR